MTTLTPSRPPVFNLPNNLTFARFVLALVLFALIALDQWIASIVVFALAAVTDWFDGYFARKLNLGSTLGRNLDPLVDKVLICGAYIFLIPKAMEDGWLPPWMVTVVVARELIITSLRGYLESQGAVFGADWLGKLKMGLQCAALFAIFIAQGLQAVDLSEGWRTFFVLARDVLIWAMVAVTALSGLQYLWKAALLLKTDS